MKLQEKLILILCGALMYGNSFAQTEVESRITFGPKGRPMCEDYAKLLNSAKPKEPLQVCGSQIDQLRGTKPIAWEELDPLHNLELLHKVEWLLDGQIKPNPAHEFKDWLKQFQRRAKNPASLPRLKRARVTVESDQLPRMVYSYEVAGSGCNARKLAAWDKGFGSFLLFEDEINKGYDWTWKRGYPFIYDNRIHVFYPYLNEKTHYLEWTAVIETFDGKKIRGRDNSSYERENVCSFKDANIFYPPPLR